MKLIYGIVFSSICTLFLFIHCHELVSFIRVVNTPSPADLSQYKARVSEINREVSEKTVCVAFIGDSHAHRNYLYFKELFNNRAFINLGIPNDTTSLLMSRLDVLENNFAEYFILFIGSNDVGRGVKTSQTMENFIKIIEAFNQRKLFVVSVPPAYFPLRNNEKVKTLNAKLSDLSLNDDFYFVDITPLLLDENNVLNSELYVDGVHLNDKGMKLLSSYVTGALTRHSILRENSCLVQFSS